MAINIVMCAHPRAGTNWLKNRLVSRGYYECNEWLHVSEEIYNSQFWPRINLAEQENRDFGIKVFPNHLNSRSYSWEQFISLLPHEKTAYIRVKRLDIEAAAKSWSGAECSGSWFGSSQNKGRLSEVDDYVKRLNGINEYWDDNLTGEHLFVAYEDMVADMDEQLNLITSYIDRVKGR